MKYLIGTGYVEPPEGRQANYPGGARRFWPVWLANTLTTSSPDKIAVVTAAHCRPSPMDNPSGLLTVIELNGDLGHVHDLIEGRKPYEWTGWSMAVMTTALLAYQNECDLIWKEQDTLAFGLWVNQMYEEIGDHQCIFGSAKCMPAVQSLFLVKHAFLPQFVRLFLDTGDERKDYNIGENKFARLQEQHPDVFTRYSFGYDRDRPFDTTQTVFYVQHLTEHEMQLLQTAGLLPEPVLRKMQFGCGGNRLPGWDNYDSEVDISKPLAFPSGCASHLFAEHVVEHITIPHAYSFFVECFRLLAPGGVLRIAVPDVVQIWRNMSEAYVGVGTRRSALSAILHGHGHQAAWTGDLLEAILQSIGFKTERFAPGASNDPVLKWVEQHGKVIGHDINSIETVCVEATRP